MKSRLFFIIFLAAMLPMHAMELTDSSSDDERLIVQTSLIKRETMNQAQRLWALEKKNFLKFHVVEVWKPVDLKKSVDAKKTLQFVYINCKFTPVLICLSRAACKKYKTLLNLTQKKPIKNQN